MKVQSFSIAIIFISKCCHMAPCIGQEFLWFFFFWNWTLKSRLILCNIVNLESSRSWYFQIFNTMLSSVCKDNGKAVLYFVILQKEGKWVTKYIYKHKNFKTKKHFQQRSSFWLQSELWTFHNLTSLQWKLIIDYL